METIRAGTGCVAPDFGREDQQGDRFGLADLNPHGRCPYPPDLLQAGRPQPRPGGVGMAWVPPRFLIPAYPVFS